MYQFRSCCTDLCFLPQRQLADLPILAYLLWLFSVVSPVWTCYSRAKVGKHFCFTSRNDLKRKFEYFCFPVAASQVKFSIPSQARPSNCRQECLSYVRRRAYAAPPGTLADAFRFPLVCHVYGLAQTCWEHPLCPPFTCTIPCSNGEWPAVRSKGSACFFLFPLKTLPHEV